jgi:hypothetical protein
MMIFLIGDSNCKSYEFVLKLQSNSPFSRKTSDFKFVPAPADPTRVKVSKGQGICFY